MESTKICLMKHDWEVTQQAIYENIKLYGIVTGKVLRDINYEFHIYDPRVYWTSVNSFRVIETRSVLSSVNCGCRELKEFVIEIDEPAGILPNELQPDNRTKIRITKDEWTDIEGIVRNALASDGKVFCSTLRSVCKAFEMWPSDSFWTSKESFTVCKCPYQDGLPGGGCILYVSQPEISPEQEALKKKFESFTESLGQLKTFNLNFDPVSKPSHYTEGRKYEPRKVIYDWGLNFNLGNAVKYISRAGRKENTIEDLEKAIQYIEFELEELKNAES